MRAPRPGHASPAAAALRAALLAAVLAALLAAPGAARAAQARGADSTAATAREPTTGVTMAPDGIHVAYETLGDAATAVVLVHGWAGDRSYWAGPLPASPHPESSSADATIATSVEVTC